MGKIAITVKKIVGKCPLYRVGDRILLNDFYIVTNESANICLHAFTGLSTLLSAFAHGISAKDLGIGKHNDLGCLQCARAIHKRRHRLFRDKTLNQTRRLLEVGQQPNLMAEQVFM